MSWLVLPSDYWLVGQYYEAAFGAKAWDTECWRKEKAVKEVHGGRYAGNYMFPVIPLWW